MEDKEFWKNYIEKMDEANHFYLRAANREVWIFFFLGCITGTLICCLIQLAAIILR